MQGWYECKTSMTMVEDIKHRITIYTILAMGTYQKELKIGTWIDRYVCIYVCRNSIQTEVRGRTTQQQL